MPRTKVNVPALYAALDAARANRCLSWRQLAREVGVSPSTFSRLANQLRPDVDTFAAMVRWLRVPAERLMVDDEAPNRDKPDLMAELAVLLRSRGIDAGDVEYLEGIIGAAVRRFSIEARAGEARQPCPP
jgi:transcriptional regulator with XRE-family HTH domain